MYLGLTNTPGSNNKLCERCASHATQKEMLKIEYKTAHYVEENEARVIHLHTDTAFIPVCVVCTCFRFGHQRSLFALERHRSRGKCPNLPVLPKLSKFPLGPVDPKTLLILPPSGPLKHCLSALNLPNHQSPPTASPL